MLEYDMSKKRFVGPACLIAALLSVSTAPCVQAQEEGGKAPAAEDAPPAPEKPVAGAAETGGGNQAEIDRHNREIQPGAAATAAVRNLDDMTPAQKADLLTALRRDYHRARRSIMTKEQQLQRDNEDVRRKIDEINEQIRELYDKVKALQDSTATVYAEAEPALAEEYEKVDKIEETMRNVRDSMRPPTPPAATAKTGDNGTSRPRPKAPQLRPRGAKR
jgi:uncharacterized coiled-coil protein SlyX